MTTGEQSDGKYLQDVIEKSQETGMEIETVLGDTAYTGKDNILYAQENRLQLVSKLNPVITDRTRSREDEFEFNKDANLLICPAGHLATRKAGTGKKIKYLLISLMLRNVRIVRFVRVVIKKERKVKVIRFRLNQQHTRIKKPFKILMNVKKRQNHVIKLKRKTVS